MAIWAMRRHTCQGQRGADSARTFLSPPSLALFFAYEYLHPPHTVPHTAPSPLHHKCTEKFVFVVFDHLYEVALFIMFFIHSCGFKISLAYLSSLIFKKTNILQSLLCFNNNFSICLPHYAKTALD